jgi:SEC-C motif-containing protein
MGTGLSLPWAASCHRSSCTRDRCPRGAERCECNIPSLPPFRQCSMVPLLFGAHSHGVEAIEGKGHTGGNQNASGVDSGNDDGPEMRPKPISAEQREDVIAHMAAGFLGAYQYFRVQRETHAGPTTFTPEPRHNAPKVERNDPFPCGSGKKYKRCCGGATVN